MAAIGMRIYFIEENKIVRVGLNTKKRFLHLAGKKVPCVTVIFKKGENTIIDMRIDPAYIDLQGYWTMELEQRYAASVLDKIFKEMGISKKVKKTDNVVSFIPRPGRVQLSDVQKELLKKRIDRDFGPNTWNTLPPGFKANLWLKGRGSG